MACQGHRFSLIEPPATHIYATLFIVFAIVAAFTNITALCVLWSPRTISKSNRILVSLAVSDMMTGLLGFPVSAYELLSNQKDSCDFDNFRAFVSLVLTGSSNLTLALISFDRYLLLTKYSKYNKVMSSRLLTILILICWIYPSVTPALKYVKNPYPYLASLVLIFYGPILFIIVFYCLLVREIYQSGKNIQQHGRKHLTGKKKIAPTDDDITTPSANAQLKRSEKRHLKTAKAVAALLACYCVCMAPFNLWLVCSIVNGSHPFIDLLSLQHWYVFGVAVAGWNSCLNPFFYLSKQPGAKKKLRVLLKRGRHGRETLRTDTQTVTHF
jgi:7 transmembrane receptor (rhodopsin family).